MAIHSLVMYSPDRHWRVSADPAGNKIIIEYDLVLQATLTNLPAVVAYLADHGIDIADLIMD